MDFKTGDRLIGAKDSVSVIVDLSANYLQQFDFVDFALLFGSYAENRINNLSDVDIGIFTVRDISLLEVGFLVARLESILDKKVDLVILNDLYKKNSLFSFGIISNNKMLFCKNNNSFIKFKKNVLLYFMDTKKLIDTMDEAFRERLASGKFGSKNYAGTD